jgi:hypothetical protein
MHSFGSRGASLFVISSAELQFSPYSIQFTANRLNGLQAFQSTGPTAESIALLPFRFGSIERTWIRELSVR